MEFLRIDPRLDEHPDCEEAGFAGVAVFEGVLRAIARIDGRGRLPAKYSPRWLAKHMNIQRDDIGGQDPEAWVSHGLARCAAVGLLARDGEDLVAPGWDKFYTAKKTGAERTAAWEERRKERLRQETECPDAADTERQPASAHVSHVKTDATPLHSTPHDVTEAEERSRAREREPSVPLDPINAQVVAVYGHYRDKFQRRHPEPNTEERGHILARLRESYEPDELKTAIDGLANSGFHRDKAMTALRCAIGSRDAVERCMQWAKSPPDVPRAGAGPPHDVRRGVVRAEDMNHGTNEVDANGNIRL